MTDAEWEAIQKAAALSEVSASDLIRDVVLRHVRRFLGRR
jgi:hypothetical protein